MTGLNGVPAPHDRQDAGDEALNRSRNTILPLKRKSTTQDLSAVSLLAALDYDDRPTFAIDLRPDYTPRNGPSTLVYCNAALRVVDGLLAKVSGQEDEGSVFSEPSSAQLAFQDWLHGEASETDPQRRGNAYVFEGHIWNAVAVEHYKIVSGMSTLLLWTDAVPGRLRGSARPRKSRPPARKLSKPSSPQNVGSSLSAPPSSPPTGQHGPFDYTQSVLHRSAADDPHIAYFRSVDWAATPFGPMASWSAELRCVVNLTLNTGYPAVVFWGDDLLMIYNQEYTQLIGAIHPCMGKSIRTMAPQHWPAFEPLIQHMNKTGRHLVEDDMPLFIDRHGASEETHWSFQYVPVLDNNGYVAGYYHSFFETTDHHLLKRRVSSLVEVGSQTANARDFQSFWEIALHTLTLNSKDVPFALLYATEGSARADMSTVSSPGSAHVLDRCLLKGSIGVRANHPVAPSIIDINDESYIFHPFLLQAAKSRKATIVHLSDLPSSEETLYGIDWKGYGDPCRIVVICPVLPTNGDQVEGFLILGMNPRRPFDEDYQQFVEVMLRLFATSLASVVLFDEEVRQREMAIGQAARIQEQLLAELQLKEKRFQRFAERSNVGIFIVDPAGTYTYRNQRWYDLFEGAGDVEDAQSAWNTIAFPEDIKRCETVFMKLVVDHEDVLFELKTRTPWTPPSDARQPESEGAEHNRWILCSAYPELDVHGNLVEIVGNVTDISQQKWAEGIQKLRTDSALESKQHLEHFIDTTSHEMRNPLSCILQCADGIICSYSPTDSQPPTPHAWSEFLEQTLDAAQTIVQCAQHMRHIVDDILTISKLNSGLLVITPVDSQPESIAKHAVKMFEAEAKAAGVELSFAVDQSYRDLRVDWVSLDPTRLLQILINLLTNAIKFTRLEADRHVAVSLAASVAEPASIPGGMQFNEERLVGEDQHLQDDWKRDPDLFFIQFSVCDTGRGLTEEERGNLFTRFSQASPRTHIHYGGSGLGLFISRRLTELQGGAIGLESKPKKGSTFSFYVKTRRTKPVMTRKGSLPMVFPEDVRHRPDTGLMTLCCPPPPIRIPSKDSTHHSNPPSPGLQRQTTLERRISITHPTIPPQALGLPPQPSLQTLAQSTHIPETLHVLVVEDNLVNQRVLAKQLRNLGCVVSVANHGQEALDFLPKTSCWNPRHPSSRRPSCHIPSTEPLPETEPDLLSVELSLILMDWEMPIMNGLTAVAKIRELEKSGVMRGRVPVIGVTANVREQQIQTAISAGMDDVVGKPFRVAELLVRMKGIVGGLAGSSSSSSADGGHGAVMNGKGGGNGVMAREGDGEG